MLMPNIFGEDLFDTFMGDFMKPMHKLTNYSAGSSIMKTDIKETETGYELAMDLPGVNKEDVKAELKDGYLTITATHGSESENTSANGKFIRKERYYGSSSRSFFVGKQITQEDIKAKFENGVLKLLVPKKEEKPDLPESHFIQIEG